MKHELTIFQLAQEITDEVLGKGTYKRLNKFDPSKGETRQHLEQKSPTAPVTSKPKRRT